MNYLNLLNHHQSKKHNDKNVAKVSKASVDSIVYVVTYDKSDPDYEGQHMAALQNYLTHAMLQYNAIGRQSGKSNMWVDNALSGFEGLDDRQGLFLLGKKVAKTKQKITETHKNLCDCGYFQLSCVGTQKWSMKDQKGTYKLGFTCENLDAIRFTLALDEELINLHEDE